MDPLGTITVYFPFIDDETKEVLETTMNKAVDYSDFVKLLTERVLEETCSDMIVYFTLHHSLLLFDLTAVESIDEKYNHRIILIPSLLLCYTLLGRSDDESKILDAIDEVRKENQDEWLDLEMRIIKFEIEMMNYPESMYEETNLESIIDIIEKNPQFRFYESVLFDNFSDRAMAAGDSNGRLLNLEKGLACAREFDDRVRISDFLNKKARIIIDEQREEARNLLQQSIDIATSLGLKTDFAYAHDQLSKIESTRGEYNLAIKHYEDNITILESVGFPSGNTSLSISTLYNAIGQYDSGYEWGLMAEDQFQSRPIHAPRAILNQAWSLILLGKKTEAILLMDSIREKILKSGQETQIAWLHFVTGVLEITDGNLTAAASSIEEALKIYENREGTLMMQVIFLRYLAEIEVAQSDFGMSLYPSLGLLEEKSRDEDLPGILGQVLLLKAELAIKQNDDSLLRDIIQELEPLTEMESLQFLKPQYDSLLSRI